MRVLRSRVKNAAPTIQVHDLSWGLRLGRFAHNGPSAGMGRKRGLLVRLRRRIAISMPLAGAAGIFVAGIIYGLYEHTVESSNSPSHQWIAVSRPEVGTPQLPVDAPSGQARMLARPTRDRHARIWQRVGVTFPRVPRHHEAERQFALAEPAARLASASRPPPTSAGSIPVSRLALNAPATAAQPQSFTRSEHPPKGKMAATARRVLDQNGVPTSANPHAPPKRDRSARRRVHSPRGQSTDTDILDTILSWLTPQEARERIKPPPLQKRVADRPRHRIDNARRIPRWRVAMRDGKEQGRTRAGE